MSIDPARSVEEIVRVHPEALKVFAKYKIDLCCGGRHPLTMVAQKHGLDLNAILRELETAIAVKT